VKAKQKLLEEQERSQPNANVVQAAARVIGISKRWAGKYGGK